MKKALIFGGLMACVSYTMHAQQMGQYSQYVQNPMILNPAATGIYDYTDINLSMRQQWTGLDDAPSTYYLSANHRFGKKVSVPSYSPTLRTSVGGAKELEPPKEKRLYHGLGGYLLSDEYGAFRKLTGNISYAIHLPVGKNYHFSIGLGAGVSNLAFDRNKVDLATQADNTYDQFIANGTASTFLDLNGGIWFYSDRLFLGYASNQLLGDRVSFGDNLATANLGIHHFATLGYRIPVSENFDLTPSVMFKMMGPAPASFDFTLQGEFAEKFWIGASYRHQDAIIGLLGLRLNNMFKVGYSYDYSISTLQNFNSGGHEVLLGIMLGNN